MLLASALFGGQAAAAELPPWQRIEFEAKKLFLTARASLSITDAAPAIPRGRCSKPLGEPKPSLEGIHSRKSSALIEVGSRFLGRQSRSRIWFDTDSSRAFFREQVETGGRRRLKTYRFCRDGVAAHRATPGDGQQSEDPRDWTQRRDNDYPYSATDLAGSRSAVSEPAVLLHLLPQLAAEAKPTDRELWVFSNNRLFRVAIRPLGRRAMKLASSVELPGLESRTVEAIGFSVEPVATDGAADDTDFRVLGLEGALEVWTLPDHRLPIELAGRIPNAGRVKVRLKRVEARD